MLGAVTKRQEAGLKGGHGPAAGLVGQLRWGHDFQEVVSAGTEDPALGALGLWGEGLEASVAGAQGDRGLQGG